MTRGLMKSTSCFAIAAAAGLFATSAMAADLGGNCCADLEERVAELEATTARKGNRKVSLTVYGRINTSIMWHDSDEPDAYRADKLTVRQNDNSPTVFGFKGEAQVRPDLTAGYLMEIWVQEDFSTRSHEVGNAFRIRQNNVYLDHKTFGRITLGQASTIHDGLYEINLANTVKAPGQGNEEMALMGNAYKTTFDDPFDGARQQGIFYRTPSLGGFVLGVGYFHDRQADGEVDTLEGWEVGLRYAGEFNGVRLAAGIGYREVDNNDAKTNTIDDQIWLGSASVMHVPTGLFLSGGYANTDSEYANRERSGWWVMAGIEKNWTGVGNTTIYGEYSAVDWKHEAAGEGDWDLSRKNKKWVASLSNDPTADRLDGSYWGLGIVQTIDAAAVDLYLNFRRYELDGGVSSTYTYKPFKKEYEDTVTAGDRDANVVTAGMRIQF